MIRQKSGLANHLPAEVLDIICLHIAISYEMNAVSAGVILLLLQPNFSLRIIGVTSSESVG